MVTFGSCVCNPVSNLGAERSMALKAMSMFSSKLFSDVMKIMFANSFNPIYNGLRQAILHGALTGETNMTTRTLKLCHTSKEVSYSLKNEIEFSFVTHEDMRKIVWWIGNVDEGKLAARASTNSGEYQFIRFLGKYGKKEEMYAAFMSWIRFVFADMFVDE
jgi:hypothetical protein